MDSVGNKAEGNYGRGREKGVDKEWCVSGSVLGHYLLIISFSLGTFTI